MQKILAATGYQINGTTVVSSGDTSAILSAVALFTALFLRAEMRTAEATGSLAAAVDAVDEPWTKRWRRAGLLNDSISADDLIAIAVSTGNTGAVARRP
ncbi:hypothetical protein [Brevibacterium oceani]|uniref:hypothetical protein n=1 Tax=Brevibacterium oceani TaxID=358099 RepID=UPI001B335D3D|nr:hypothetical protein [Brevibacterium oceani]